MIRKNENAYLTVYLALIFGIVLSLFFALIEGAAAGAVRAQAELVADLGMDSVFAEYHRGILDRYGLFFIDSSYGTVNGGVGMVEARLSDYMAYNMDPEKGMSMPGTTLLKLRAPYLEIRKAAYASDENCMVWKAQAVQYMKAVYGGDFVAEVKEHLDTVQRSGFDGKDAINDISGQKEAFEEALAQNSILEFGAESDEGFSYQKASDLFDGLKGDGFLRLMLPDGSRISGAVMEGGPYFSSRMKNRRINVGTGLHEGMDRPDGLVDELIYDEYLMKQYGCHAQSRDDGLLRYQIEYVLFGNSSDAANLRSSAELLLAVRGAANLASITTDAAKKAEAETAAAVICTLLCVPELTGTLATVILGMWALTEAAADVCQLLDGGRVPLVKEGGEWSTSLSGLLCGNLSGRRSAKGLSYQDYMRIFLGLMDKDKKMARSLDIVEMDIRQTPGNSSFRIDRCIDYVEAGFGFEDAAGHDFVFNKSMCYE